MPPKKKVDGKNKYRSGFCNVGQHEGTKKKSASGAPLKACDDWECCPCKCHAEISEMYAMVDMERALPEQSSEFLEWVREQRHQFVLPSTFELDDPSVLLNEPDTFPLGGSSDVPTVPPDAPADVLSTGPHGVVVPAFTPTPTGRRARGQLEEDVRSVCEDYAQDVFEWDMCTPKAVAEEIGKRYAIEPPSTGAINAVWDRWEKIGFAQQGKKPSRFVCFEMDGGIRTLLMLKDRVKRDKKRGRAEQRRGTLRPTGGR